MGLVNTVVGVAELEEVTVQWCREMLANSPTAIRALKAALNADCDGQAGLQELAGIATMLYYMSDEAKEGRDAQLAGESEMWVQTHHPEHPLFKALRAHDYPGFAALELAEREAAGMPPYGAQALLRAEARSQEAAHAFLNAAKLSGEAWLQAQSMAVTVYPAVPMSLQRVADVERSQMLVESHSRKALQAFLNHWQNELQGFRAQHKSVIRWAIDVDPLVI